MGTQYCARFFDFLRTPTSVGRKTPRFFSASSVLGLFAYLATSASASAANISGVVTDAVTGDRLANIEVCARYEEPTDGSHQSACMLTGTDGTYTFANLPDSGNARVNTNETDIYVRQEWPDVNAGEAEHGSDIDLSQGSRSDIDFALREGFRISGRLTDEAGEPLAEGFDVQIIAFTDSHTRSFGSSRDPATGDYSTVRVIPGDYKVLARSFFNGEFKDRTVDELFPDIPCVERRCDFRNVGDLVTIDTADLTMDFALAEGYRIEGLVTDEASVAVPEHSVSIRVYDLSAARTISHTSVAAGGAYASPALPNGDYKVAFSSNDFIDEVYDNEACSGSCALETMGTAITVNGADVLGIDAQLAEGGSISGTVTAASDGSVIEGRVQARTNAGEFVESTSINTDGTYSVGGLAPGDYKVWFNANGASENFIDELFNGVNCPSLGCDVVSLGELVSVAGGVATTGIDAQLEPGAGITGLLTKSDNGEIITEATARLYDEVGNHIDQSRVDSQTGVYRLNGLVPGDYKLRVDTHGNDDIYIDQMFDAIQCVDHCDPVDGTTITVVSGEERVIDMTMQRGLTFFGRISDEADSTIPVVEGRVEVWDDQGNFLRSFFYNDADGNYQTGGLLPGDYKLVFDPSGQSERYIEELFEDISCPGFCDVRSLGTVVSLIDQDVNIDAALTRGRLITGRVLDDQGSPITEYVSAQVRHPDGSFLTSQSIHDQDGMFRVGVPNGEYRVLINPFGERESWVDQYHNGLLCGHRFCDFSTVPVIDATASDADLGDIPLTLGGDLVVQVEANTADPRPPVSNGTVWILSPLTDASGNPMLRGYSLPSDGQRIVAGLEPGDYFVGVDSRQTMPLLVDEIFDNIACPGSDCDPHSVADLQGGTPVSVQSGIDSETVFILDPVPTITISGTVVDSTTGDPLGGVTVSSNPTGQSLVTDQTGAFSLSGVPAGTNLLFMRDAYLSRVLVSNFEGGSVLCPLGNCYLAGTESVDTQQDMTGIEVDMRPGARISGSLFLPDGSPMPGHSAVVRVIDDQGIERFEFSLHSGQEGGYETEVPPGGWHLLVDGSNMNAGLVETALGQVPCPRGSCGIPSTTLVEVAQGDNVSGLDVQLLQGVPIAGSILDEDSSPAVAPEHGLALFYAENGEYAGFASTGNDGNFVSRMGFPPGTYFASTIFQRGQASPVSQVPSEFIDELYDNIPCLNGCDFTAGTPIEVGDVSTSPELVQIGLTRGSSISGTVTGPSGAVEHVRVEAFDQSGDVVGKAFTDETGAYQVAGLLPDTYFVGTDNEQGLGDEMFDNVLCEPFCNPAIGNEVVIGPGEARIGIDFVLAGASSLAGEVVDESGVALEGQVVEVYNAVGTLRASTSSDATGAWQVAGLAAGRYFVRTRNALGLVDRAYQGLDCNGCVITNTDPVDLGAGEERIGLRFELATGGAIVGTVTSSATAGPVGSVGINVFDSSGELVGTAQSATDGSFSVDGLAAPADYFVATSSSIGLIDELSPDIVCEPSCTPTDGTAISVAAGSTGTVDFELDPAGRISGAVSDTLGNPLGSMTVQAFDAQGKLVREATTGDGGGYELGGIPAGDMFLRTNAQSGFTDQVWQGFDCDPVCDVGNGTAVAVTAGETSTGIDFLLTRGFGLAGTVQSTAGDLLSSLKIDIFNNLGQPVSTATTGADGGYAAQGLPDGRYFARTRNGRSLVDEVFDDISCTPGPCRPGAGQPIDLSGGTLSGIDFELAPGSSFSGTATDQFSNPLPTGEVVLFDTTGREVKRTDIVDGNWTFSGVAEGSYFLVVQNGSRLVDELFADLPCPRSSCDVTQGTQVDVGPPPGSVQQQGMASVKASVSVSDGAINVELEPGSLIRGRLTGPDGGGVAGAVVTFFNEAGEVVGSATANAAGEYESASAFSAGTYFAATSDGEQRGVTGGLVNALFEGSTCALECDPETGSPIELDAQSDAEGIDFALAEGGAINGLAVDDLSNPLPGATIEVFDSQGLLAGAATVDSLGQWTVDGLPDGEYTVVLQTELFSEFGDFVLGAGRCSGDCDPADGDPITVSSGSSAVADPIELIPEAIIFRSGFE